MQRLYKYIKKHKNNIIAKLTKNPLPMLNTMTYKCIKEHMNNIIAKLISYSIRIWKGNK